jgi:hypothetical protein
MADPFSAAEHVLLGRGQVSIAAIDQFDGKGLFESVACCFLAKLPART